jgi:hypothetical protein
MLYRPENETSVEIYSWALFKCLLPNKEPSVHLAGLVHGDGRVCSPLQDFFEETPTHYIFKSRSNKVYKVLKESKRNGVTDLPMLAHQVLTAWLRMNRALAEDITVEQFKTFHKDK